MLVREAALGARVEHALDLGAGVGAIGLSLLALELAGRVTLVEKDALSASLLRENAAVFGARATVVEGDVADVHIRADLVVSNPPYFHESRGRPAPEARRRSARSGELEPFLAAAKRSDAPAMLLVYPSTALGGLLHAARSHELELGESRFIHADPSAPARVVVARLGPRADASPIVLPPWCERDANGVSDPELQRFLREGALSQRADDRA